MAPDPQARQGLYLYCLARADLLAALDGKGLTDRQELEILEFQGLAAVIGPVSLDDFAGPDAAVRLKDPSWLAPRVLHHEAVVEEVGCASPVLPARFGTIFSSQESLAEVLRRHHAAINQFLERVTGREEWAVKGFLDRHRAREELASRKLRQAESHLALLSPGRRYLEEQRLLAGVDRELSGWLKEVCQALQADLADYAEDLKVLASLPRQATGREADMILNWALLVPEGKVPAFQGRIAAANAQHQSFGLTIEWSGPWPPYCFTPSLTMRAEL